jgi:arylsulfatase A-like enzyme
MLPSLIRLFAISLLTAELIFQTALAAAADVSKPNIVLILADDLGYGSLNCYGGKQLETPSCDRLAREGRRFTNAYAPGSVCSPSRYGLMTGRYLWRTFYSDGTGLGEAAPLVIESDRLTLGSLAKGQGYATAAVGKWHLGLGMAQKTEWNAPLSPGPLSVGFDYFFGLAANVNNQPDAYIENDQIFDHTPGQVVAIEGKGKDRKTVGVSPLRQPNEVMSKLTGKAVHWIEENRSHPFFLYFAPNAVHEPVTPSADFTGSPFGKYGDFIHELDWSVGQILTTLEKNHLMSNTLIIFTSDNGGALNVHLEESMVAMKAGLAINGPLRDGKGSVWEGGFREPFIVWWPGKVPAGTVSDDVICLTDVLATMAGIIKAPLPEGNAEDSFDVGPSWFGDTTHATPRKAVVLQAEAAAEYAVREGPWKMIERLKPPPFQTSGKDIEKRIIERRKHWPDHNELYNLADDPAETKDVSAEHLDVVTRLMKVLQNARDKHATRPELAQKP